MEDSTLVMLWQCYSGLIGLAPPLPNSSRHSRANAFIKEAKPAASRIPFTGIL